MRAFATGTGSCIITARRAAAAIAVAASVLVLAACDDGRTFKNQSQQGQSAKLVVPDTLTPPVQVMPVVGAPAAWRLHHRVAEALRQRDIPAGVKMRGSHVYVLRGRVMQIHRTGAQTQVTVKWRLVDGNGTQVGEVTQMAAIPTQKAGADARDHSDDVTQAMADAAAESLSPIVPSSRLKTSQQAMTGLPAKRSRREYEKRNPVTAIGKGQKKQTHLGRNLLTKDKSTLDRKVAIGASPAGAPGKQKTALGRRGAGKSPLSRNLMRRKPLRTPTDKRNALPVPGKARANDRANNRSNDRGNRTDQRAERVSGTTSDAARTPATTRPNAPTGSMEELIRRHPTRTEREDGGVTRPAPAARDVAGATPATRSATPPATRPGTRPASRRSRQIASRPPTRRTASRRKQVKQRYVRRARPKISTPGRRLRSARDVVPGRRVYWVQIGSYRSRMTAERHWRAIRRTGGPALLQANRRIMRAKIERRGVFYRVQVGPYTRRSVAYTMCRTLKDRDIDCFLYGETEQASLPVTRAGGPRTNPAAGVSSRVVLRSKPRRRSIRRSIRPSIRPSIGPSIRHRPAGRPSVRRLSPDPRPNKAPVSTRPGLPGLKN